MDFTDIIKMTIFLWVHKKKKLTNSIYNFRRGKTLNTGYFSEDKDLMFFLAW